jgi:hypothetical protein
MRLDFDFDDAALDPNLVTRRVDPIARTRFPTVDYDDAAGDELVRGASAGYPRIREEFIDPNRLTVAVRRHRHRFFGHRLQEVFIAIGAPEALEDQLGHLLRAEHGGRAAQHDDLAQFDFRE